LCRSVFEGVALNSRWLLGYVEKMAGKKFEAINFIGGAANSSIWSQIFADIYDRPVRAMKDPLISNSRGTALLALVALGMLKVEDISKTVEVRETYLPNPKNRNRYDETFASFLEIYKRNKSIFAKLNRT
jgi:xylulokinase